MPEPMTWEHLRQLFTALGYTQTTFSQAALAKFPGAKGLSQPAISRQLSRDRQAPVPEAVAEWAWTLTPLSGAEKGFAAFLRAKAFSASVPANAGKPPAAPDAQASTPESGMNASIHSSNASDEASAEVATPETPMNISIPRPTPEIAPSASRSTIATPGPGIPAREVAPPVVVQFEPSQIAEVAKQTVTEVLAHMPRPVDSSEMVKQTVTEVLAQLPKPADLSEVAKTAATETVAQQPKPPHPSEVAAHVVRALSSFFALIVVLLLTGFVGVAALGRRHDQAPSVPAAAPTPSVVVNFGTGLLNDASPQRLAPRADNSPYAFGVRPLEAGQLGEKASPERYIPKNPLPGQKLAPHCNPDAAESTINGACWVSTGDKRPPCGRWLFRNGDKCYMPVAADPNVPVSSQPE